MDPPRVLSPATAMVATTPLNDPPTSPTLQVQNPAKDSSSQSASDSQATLAAPLQIPDPGLPSQTPGPSPGSLVNNQEQNQVASGSDSIQGTDSDSALRTTIKIGDQEVTIGRNGIILNAQTLTPHGKPVTMPGLAAVNEGSDIVHGDQIYHLTMPEDSPTLNVAGHSIQSLPCGALVNSVYIKAGDPSTTVSGAKFTIDTAGHIYIDDQEYDLPLGSSSPSTILANGAIVTAFANGVLISGTIFTAGAPIVTVDNTALSLDVDQNLIFNPTAQPIPTLYNTHKVQPLPDQVATKIVDNMQHVPDGISIAGSVITKDAPAITISSDPMLPDPSVLVFDNDLVTLQIDKSALFPTSLAGHIVTSIASGIVIDGKYTVLAGHQATTIDGILLSPDQAGELVVGSQTMTVDDLTNLERSSKSGLAEFIMRGFRRHSNRTQAASPNETSSLPGNRTVDRQLVFQGGAREFSNISWLFSIICLIAMYTIYLY